MIGYEGAWSCVRRLWFRRPPLDSLVERPEGEKWTDVWTLWGEEYEIYIRMRLQVSGMNVKLFPAYIAHVYVLSLVQAGAVVMYTAFWHREMSVQHTSKT